jgi:hypothetical protein
MSKAQRLATRRNLGGGNSESFTSLSATSISFDMHKLGINLGSNDNEIQLSVMSVKNIEIDRLSVSANKRSKSKNGGSMNRVISFESDDELDTSLTHICRDINKDLHGDCLDDMLIDLEAAQ